MKLNKSISNMINNRTSYLDFEEENICPLCKSSLSPVFLSGVVYKKSQDGLYATIFNYCTACNSTFISKYYIINSKSTNSHMQYETTTPITSEPNPYASKTFDDELKQLSTQFVKIYNQALCAETSSLDEIAGIGYRKAIEFLIKDFAVLTHPEKEAEIVKMSLMSCIKTYIDDERIKSLAEKCAWLGNDEAHYFRKHEDRDIKDLKRFIDSIVYYIGIALIAEDANSMEPK